MNILSTIIGEKKTKPKSFKDLFTFQLNIQMEVQSVQNHKNRILILDLALLSPKQIFHRTRKYLILIFDRFSYYKLPY